jgi:hypothetical protein
MRRASTGGFLEGPSLRAFGRTLPIGGSVSAQLQMGTRLYPRACDGPLKFSPSSAARRLACGLFISPRLQFKSSNSSAKRDDRR